MKLLLDPAEVGMDFPVKFEAFTFHNTRETVAISRWQVHIPAVNKLIVPLWLKRVYHFHHLGSNFSI
jgi:hypothetical protein